MALELGQPLRLPAILLAGPPGVGKTHFSLQLAKAMERPIHRHSFDSAHTRDSLMGSDRHWANTEAGLVFNSVCLSDRADPLVLLDEIDKSGSQRGDSSIASLHSLLEPVTAKSVTDISAGMQFDASHVFWLATANDLSLLPEPILSRFRVFHIQPPTAEQAIALAQTVAASVHARYAGFEAPPKCVITQLAHLTPREQIQALEQTYANALRCGRKHLLCRDLPIDLQIEGAGSSIHASMLH
jgi:ATP-dependent Lon protease